MGKGHIISPSKKGITQTHLNPLPSPPEQPHFPVAQLSGWCQIRQFSQSCHIPREESIKQIAFIRKSQTCMSSIPKSDIFLTTDVEYFSTMSSASYRSLGVAPFQSSYRTCDRMFDIRIHAYILAQQSTPAYLDAKMHVQTCIPCGASDPLGQPARPQESTWYAASRCQD